MVERKAGIFWLSSRVWALLTRLLLVSSPGELFPGQGGMQGLLGAEVRWPRKNKRFRGQ